MKNILLLFLLIAVAATSNAQADLKFDAKPIDAIDKYVVFETGPKDSIYTVVFVYVDRGGLSVNIERSFKLTDGKVTNIVDLTLTSMMKARISPGGRNVAVLSKSYLDQLNLNKEPDWLKIYNRDTAGIERKFMLGSIHNGWGRSEKALGYLEQVKTINPLYKGLAFETAFAYNALKQYDKAIPVLESSIVLNPKDCLLYKELVYAHMQNGSLDKASEEAKKGILICDPNNKREMIQNLTLSAYGKNNKEQFNYWIGEFRKLFPTGHASLQQLDKMEADF